MFVTGFGPIEAEDALVLVLGTLPGAESIRMQEYYANRANAFWDVMGALFGAGSDLPYMQRTEIVRQRRVAIWDVLHSAERAGSVDSGIVKGSEVVNDFNGFFRSHASIKVIVFNGGNSRAYFRSLVMPHLTAPASALEQRTLPSTSPANARMRRDAKINAWRFVAMKAADLLVPAKPPGGPGGYRGVIRHQQAA